MRKTLLFFLLFANATILIFSQARQMEYLDRGLVAVKLSNGVALSWRFLGTDSKQTVFNIYRNDVLIHTTNNESATFYTDASGVSTSEYAIVPVLNGVEIRSEIIKKVKPWAHQYLSLQLRRPPGGKTPPNQIGSVGKTPSSTHPDGQNYTYTPNDMSVGDVDGDGEYELIVKWDPSNSQDNSFYGITGNVYLDAYKLDGTFLWRIDLGKNIRAGAHYTQFMVYDMDGDGKAEIVCKTAPGTIDGNGKNVLLNNDDPNADYRNLNYSSTSGSGMLGVVINGPEYLTLFDGATGAELHTIPYKPERGSVSSWGDNYGNRVDRFLACVAYLDGVKPSVIMCRGYYTRAALVAYDVIDKKLIERWYHNSPTAGAGAYGEGFHSLSVADVDGDGKDEIIYGSCVIDDNGSLLYRTGLGHGDAMHVSDMDPDRPGLEVWTVHETTSAAYGFRLWSAATGAHIWGQKTGTDVGRGMAGDIDARYKGFEMWSTGTSGTFDVKGNKISDSRPSVNFRIYWDGDLQDELLDGVKITKWNGNGTSTLLTASNFQSSASINSTKSNPCLSADILGDWREEVIYYNSADPSKINIFTTTISTNHRLYTPMHDPVYRLGVAWQNVSYNQPPHLGFYIGDGLSNIPTPQIFTPRVAESTNVQLVENYKPAYMYYRSGKIFVSSIEQVNSVKIYCMTGKIIKYVNAVNSTAFSVDVCDKHNMYIVQIYTQNGIQTSKIIK